MEYVAIKEGRFVKKYLKTKSGLDKKVSIKF